MKELKLSDYRADVDKLITYIPWLESKVGATVSHLYNDNDLSSSTVTFPVYDSTLLSFINDANSTSLMDTNYVYAISEYGLKTHDDERNAISEATVKDGALLSGILSKYVLGGMTRGTVWNEAVTEGIFLAVLKKMKQLLEIWDKPLA
ncbi:MAG: hypothetical protein K6A74_01115 [Lachnospiraceae bacterium]|nr:hypothetical protein [Lachnospiraceae bacterium]